MSTLFDPRKVIKVQLPSFPDAEVEIYDGLLTHQAEQLQKAENDYETGINLLKVIIKGWSFVNEKEEPLPVTKETLGLLPIKDFTVLMDSVNKTMDFLGKKEQKS